MSPQRFVGSSSQDTPYVPPPVEIIEAAGASINMYISQLDPKETPPYVLEPLQAVVAGLNRWAEEIRNPPKPPLVIGGNANVQALDPVPEPKVPALDPVPEPEVPSKAAKVKK